jgi:hypothetical protein
VLEQGTVSAVRWLLGVDANGAQIQLVLELQLCGSTSAPQGTRRCGKKRQQLPKDASKEIRGEQILIRDTLNVAQ